ncbi:MAG: ChbG/HpnK family deacetylase [Parcubacteria group bacterium]
METTGNLRKKIILSADDFGKTREGNAGILKLAQKGKLDRVAIMVNRDYLSAKDLAMIKACPVALDLHLEFPFQKKKSRSIIKRSFLFLYHHLTNQKSITAGWEEQIQKFISLFGKIPDGLNAHEHIHFFPPYFKVAIKLAKQYNIKYLRFGKVSVIKNHKVISHILFRLHKKNQPAFAASHLASSDYLASLDWLHNTEKFLKNLPAGRTEIVCHPKREKEYELIKRLF